LFWNIFLGDFVLQPATKKEKGDKMKKILSVILAVLLIAALFTSCASGSTASTAPAADDKYKDGGVVPSAAAASSAPSAAYDQSSLAGVPAEAESGVASNGSTGSGNVLNGVGATAPSNQKMIYTATAEIETTKFDGTISGVYALMNTYGAFLENSYISGKNYADTYYGNPTYRTANFTIRVPADKFSAMTSSLSSLGNVLSSNTQSQNITTQYIDTESRLKACRAEETSLLAMLEKAETVEVILAVQSRLTDVRYEIESLTSTLKNWQNQVDYSTVVLNIKEVAELTEQQPPVQRTYWEKMRDGLQSTLNGIGVFFKGLFMGLVVALPVLVILAVIAVAVIVIIRANNKKKKARQEYLNQQLKQNNQDNEGKN
jgi:flagellar basal body-associated protein FliL